MGLSRKIFICKKIQRWFKRKKNTHTYILNETLLKAKAEILFKGKLLRRIATSRKHKHLLEFHELIVVCVPLSNQSDGNSNAVYSEICSRLIISK